jgi:hypothetical protein
MADTSQQEQIIRDKFLGLAPYLNERSRRVWAALEARALGFGGIAMVERATGIHRDTITAGLQELKQPNAVPLDRIRKSGAGRHRLTEKDPTLQADLEALINPVTRGDPESALRWTSKSTQKLAAELRTQGHTISAHKIGELLREAGYSLQSNRKVVEGATDHPDRDAQFQWIADQTSAFQEANQPVISVDAKKKELVGDFKNRGQEWLPHGEPEVVNVYDFPSSAVGKVTPYGIYDITHNEGWVNVGIDHDTGAFAAESIGRWWDLMGKERYPHAEHLYITADGGGSNGSRNRLWKVSLQALANRTHLTIHVSHFPPGTSKWNKIEHRLFSFISLNWRGRVLRTLETVVNCIANTRTEKGLTVKAELDTGSYPTGIPVDDETLAHLDLAPESFHGEWNYIIKPQSLNNEVISS